MVPLLADQGGIPGVIRTVINMPERMKPADYYIGEMFQAEVSSPVWRDRRDQAVMASLPMLTHMRKELPPLPFEKNVDLYMTGIQDIVGSLTPNEEGAIKYDPSRSGFYKYHKVIGAYPSMRKEHVRLQMTATITDGDISHVLTKNEKAARRDGKPRASHRARSIFGHRKTMSLSLHDWDGEEKHGLIQALEGMISEPDNQLLSVTDVMDASNESIKWRIGIDEAIKRLVDEKSFCMDLPVFRLTTGYYPRALPPRMIDDVAEQYGLAGYSARRAVDKIFFRIAAELQVDESRLKRIVEALVDYELSTGYGIDGSEIRRSKQSSLTKKGY